MPNNYFQFKQFKIIHDKSVMKVNTDAVILGAWVNTNQVKNILDIGTGTGIIALMLAQKSNAQIDAVEIDIDTAKQAEENISQSSWKERIRIYNNSIQNYSTDCSIKYDLIVSNPPFFIKSLKSIKFGKLISKHDDKLSYTELFVCVKQLLSSNGFFNLIIPSIYQDIYLKEAYLNNLHCTKKLMVFPREDIGIKRVVMEFSFHKTPLVEQKLIIENSPLHFTEDYKKLTEEYYLDEYFNR